MNTIRKIKTNAIGWLLFHANSSGKNFPFYAIKNELVVKYGTFVGHDVQYIEGKTCYSCEGTGTYRSLYKREICYHCYGTGQYTPDRWVILERYLVGDHSYVFHKPVHSTEIKPELLTVTIKGYVSHKKTKWNPYALAILFLVYEKGYLKRFYHEAGNGFMLQWWLPSNIPYNIIHFIKYGFQSYPIIHLKERLKKLTKPAKPDTEPEELPF